MRSEAGDNLVGGCRHSVGGRGKVGRRSRRRPRQNNAIKFTHEGKVGIKLYVVADPNLGNDELQELLNDGLLDPCKEGGIPHHEGKVWIRCDVHDTGIGIPEHALPTLFKKYMQVSADTARKYGGTGLGLAICKQLVELMGGHLTVSSREHHGSTFTFVLPYTVSPAWDSSDDLDELSDMASNDLNDDDTASGFFQFHPRTMGSLSSCNDLDRPLNLKRNGFISNTLDRIDGFSGNLYSLPLYEGASEGILFAGNASSNDSTAKTTVDECHPSKLKDESSDVKMRQHKDSFVCENHYSEILNSLVSPSILLAEDNKINVMVTRSMMKQLGYDIDIVNNGAEAVRAAQRSTYNLILMDVCMPVMDGLQATRLIRSFERTGSWVDAVEAGITDISSSESPSNHCVLQQSTRTPIVAMTANALSESAEECFASGMDSFVSKPITFQNLKQCLEQYLPQQFV